MDAFVVCPVCWSSTSHVRQAEALKHALEKDQDPKRPVCVLLNGVPLSAYRHLPASICCPPCVIVRVYNCQLLKAGRHGPSGIRHMTHAACDKASDVTCACSVQHMALWHSPVTKRMVQGQGSLRCLPKPSAQLLGTTWLQLKSHFTLNALALSDIERPSSGPPYATAPQPSGMQAPVPLSAIASVWTPVPGPRFSAHFCRQGDVFHGRGHGHGSRGQACTGASVDVG